MKVSFLLNDIDLGKLHYFLELSNILPISSVVSTTHYKIKTSHIHNTKNLSDNLWLMGVAGGFMFLLNMATQILWFCLFLCNNKQLQLIFLTVLISFSLPSRSVLLAKSHQQTFHSICFLHRLLNIFHSTSLSCCFNLEAGSQNASFGCCLY